MKLSKLYSNSPDKFAPVAFTPGLNVVLAEIRLPENKEKDTHNLGKTTLARVIDFCLLAGGGRSFLTKHIDRFKDFVFFLEIELLDGSFVTVRRGVTDATKISFKRHHESARDFSELRDDAWDHVAITFDRAKELLDGMLDLRDLKPWTYRHVVGYLLRSQDDFREVFQLKKFAGPHSRWKPFLAHILGFDDSIIHEHYAKEEELRTKEEQKTLIERELGDSVNALGQVEGLLQLKQKDSATKQHLLDTFDFRLADAEKIRTLVDELNTKIAALNSDQYSLAQNKKRIVASLQEDAILFDPASAAALFAEAGVIFSGQIRKEFEQLIAFNRAISDERRGYLKQELAEIDVELKRTNAELAALGKRRADTLGFLSGTDVFVKYRQLTDELVTLKAEIAALELRRSSMRQLQELRASIRALVDERDQLQTQIEKDVSEQNADAGSTFSIIRIYFAEIVEAVINRKALLDVSVNQQGHLEFRADILDDGGNTTSADQGTSYRKLLCVAFDLAVARAHHGGRYPRFVFHDGVFETLDDRKKENLMAVMRSHSELGIQHLITLIDSDLPDGVDGATSFIRADEVVLRLHDADETGRLFRMGTW